MSRDDPSLPAMMVAELARMRSGFIAWYTLLAPVVIAVPLYVGSLFSPEGQSGELWQVFSNVTLELWGVLVPMTAGLIAAISIRADTEPWRFLLSYAVPRWRYFFAKTTALAVAQLLSATILGLMLVGGALLTGQAGHQMGMIAEVSYLPWIAGLAMTALAALVSTLWGLGPGIAIGIAGALTGALISDKSFWYVMPPAWPMRVILPLAHIHPNGIALNSASPLNNASVVPVALVLSAVITVAALVVGGWHMTRKEI